MNLIKAALIDLDGTLLDTIPDLARAANALRHDYDLPTLPVDQLRSYVGKGMQNLVARTLKASMDGELPDPELTEAVTVFRKHYHQINGCYATLYPDAIEGLSYFRDLGIPIAIVTNKPLEFTLPLLERFELMSYVDTVVAGDSCHHKKPHPEPLLFACQRLKVSSTQAVMIGDSFNDVQAGLAAQSYTLLLPYGYNEGKSVQTLEVNGIVDSILHAAIWVKQHNLGISSC